MFQFETEEDPFSVAQLIDLVEQRLGIAPDQQILVAGETALVPGDLLTDPHSPIVVHLYRRPGPGESLCVLTRYLENVYSTARTGESAVAELKRALARAFLVRPALQKLFSLKKLMQDEEELGSYAIDGTVTVDMCVGEDEEDHERVCVSVKRRLEPGYSTFVLDDVDTFDVLAGMLEREGEVRKGEHVAFVSDGIVFDGWKTFRDYQMTHAKLRIA